MSITIGDSVSRVRNLVKGVKEDAFLTDRLLYSLIIKYGRMLIRREDEKNKLMRMQTLFVKLPCIELIEVNKIEACCGGIKSNCTIKRTKEKVPQMLEGAYGPLIRSISSIDGSIELYSTIPSLYTSIINSTNYKYNKNKYYWYLDGHLYFPDIEWEAVSVEALFEDSVERFVCDGDVCRPRQDDNINIPEYLFAELEQMVVKDLLSVIQIPAENDDNNQNPLRT
jgi:hypothetical protein